MGFNDRYRTPYDDNDVVMAVVANAFGCLAGVMIMFLVFVLIGLMIV